MSNHAALGILNLSTRTFRFVLTRERPRPLVADTLTSWKFDHDCDLAVLLVSELVTNAVVHAGTDIALTLRCEGRQLTVEVHDGSHQMPTDLDVQPTSSSGRGVHLLAAVADDWGVHAIPGDGKVVWFSLSR